MHETVIRIEQKQRQVELHGIEMEIELASNAKDGDILNIHEHLRSMREKQKASS